MKPPAAKEKTTQAGPLRPRDRASHVRAPRPARASGPTPSYLKTRVRASRLLAAARILAIAELTRRLHQAYRFAYDKQAADSVLPQNPPVGPEDLKSYKGRIEEMLRNPDCASFIQKLLDEAKAQTGRPHSNILTTFDKIRFFWGQGTSHAHYAQGAPAATIRNTIITERPSGSLANQKDRHAFLISQTTQSFLGETLHHVGQGFAYADGVMANAMNAILVKQGLDISKTFSDLTPTDTNNASIYWHPKVWAACPAPRK